MNKVLRIIRIFVSLTVFLILSVGLTLPLWAIPGVYEWMVEIQLGRAIMMSTLAVFVGWAIITLVFGRLYCSSVCPMGTMMDLSSSTRRLTRRGRRRVYRWSPPNNALRYGILALAVVCLVGGFTIAWKLLDPFSAFGCMVEGFVDPVIRWLCFAGMPLDAARVTATMGVSTSIIATLVFAVTVVIAYQNGRALCNTICPVGTLLGLVSRYSIFQINIDTDRCTQCRRCEYACKSHCIDLNDHVVDSSRCVNCFSCLSVCRDDAIHYTTNRKQLSQPLMQKIKGLAAEGSEGEAEPTVDSTNNTINNETIS